MESFTFSSLHEYLDYVLRDNPNASWDEIKDAKKRILETLLQTLPKRKKNKKERILSWFFIQKQLQQIHQKKR